jgi:hypothetical protein
MSCVVQDVAAEPGYTYDCLDGPWEGEEVSRRTIGWVTGVLAAGGAVEALTINNVNAGWGWVLGAAVATLLLASLAGWLAYHNAPDPPTRSQSAPAQAAGSVFVAGKVIGSIRTMVKGLQYRDRRHEQLGSGSVHVDPTGRVGGDIETRVEGYSAGGGPQP